LKEEEYIMDYVCGYLFIVGRVLSLYVQK